LSRYFSIVVSVILLVGLSPLRAERGADPRYGRLPIAFENNVGQAPAVARYIARAANYKLILTDNETILELNDSRHSTIRMKMPSTSPDARFELLEKLPGISNYYLGNDPCGPQESRRALSDLLFQPIIVMQSTEDRLGSDAVTEGKLMPMAACRKIRLDGFRCARA
jgi:hypothetical protein